MAGCVSDWRMVIYNLQLQCFGSTDSVEPLGPAFWGQHPAGDSTWLALRSEYWCSVGTPRWAVFAWTLPTRPAETFSEPPHVEAALRLSRPSLFLLQVHRTCIAFWRRTLRSHALSISKYCALLTASDYVLPREGELAHNTIIPQVIHPFSCGQTF